MAAQHPQTTLPPEIIANILTQSITHSYTCALSLLCPEWHVCARRHRALETLLRSTRVDTYTLPLDPSQPGSVSTTFDHGPEEHASLCRPLLDDPRRVEEKSGRGDGVGELMLAGALPEFYQRELVREWASRSVVVVGQEVNAAAVGPLWREMSEEEVKGLVLLREQRAVRLLPFEDDFAFPRGPEYDGATPREEWMVYGEDFQEKERLPALWGEGREGPRYVFQRIRHLVVNCVPALAGLEAADLGTVPSTWNPAAARNLVWLTGRLEYERKANLRIRWDAMVRLESLFLDLRGYTVTKNLFINVEDVLRLARSLKGKSLELLVIAGLRSGTRYHGPDPLTMEDVEGGVWDAQWQLWGSKKRGRGVNWFLMFKDAVRPGGRLVFVDRSDGNMVKLLR
ncbi:hypothetical protein N658DRAFT_118658 [Parathielavia hyrcaniae]|uniref:F-box domain-containing protein n=1 Tax=Parathielavia hyrcaniae TaxID=113614 RepID=A0AAN6T660_9PEZI|nr:hypothetical protein N658DRAFT_118658 [Parathielavia hyrcaniae]